MSRRWRLRSLWALLALSAGVCSWEAAALLGGRDFKGNSKDRMLQPFDLAQGPGLQT